MTNLAEVLQHYHLLHLAALKLLPEALLRCIPLFGSFPLYHLPILSARQRFHFLFSSKFDDLFMSSPWLSIPVFPLSIPLPPSSLLFSPLLFFFHNHSPNLPLLPR